VVVGVVDALLRGLGGDWVARAARGGGDRISA
jgi:hypothetical protein